MLGPPRAGVVAACVAGAALAFPSAAAAHLRTGLVAVDDVVRLDAPLRMTPLSVAVRPGDGRLSLAAGHGHRVVVLGYAGEPFLRIGPSGVWVNQGSPTAAVTSLARRSAGRGWRLLRRAPAVSWLDERVQPLRSGQARVRWAIPVLVDGRRRWIAGVVIRAAPAAVWPWAVALAAVAVVSALLAWLMGAPALRRGALLLGPAAAACALVAAAGFAVEPGASPGTRIAAVDEAVFALVGLGVLLWGPARARAAAGGGLGLLAVAVGASEGAIFLHPVVLSPVPGAVVRALVTAAVAAGLAAAAAAALWHARVEEPLLRLAPAP